MALFDDASLVVTPNGYKAGTLYSIKPTSGAGDMTVVRATTATRVNSAGLIESVANNVPRLDYSNGTCPSILVEPQRTNLLSYSEQFDNAAWSKNSTTITANAIVSPDGSTNADLITTSAAALNLFQANTVTAGQTHTASIFVKAGSLTQFSFGFSDNTIDEGRASFNLTTLTATPIASTSWINQSSSIQSYGNGWYRCIYTGTNTSASTTIPIIFRANAAGNLYLYGAQHEANSSYPTSYIPTTSAAVTRNADVISKTGISSLIGQTEGAMFCDVNIIGSFDANNMLCTISDGTISNRIFLNLTDGVGHLELVITNLGSTTVSFIGSTPSTGRHKIAVAYKANDVVLYLDGALIHTDTVNSIPATSKFNIGSFYDNTLPFNSGINSAILFPTRLTNSELISLTTI